jgi:hypothetical protein
MLVCTVLFVGDKSVSITKGSMEGGALFSPVCGLQSSVNCPLTAVICIVTCSFPRSTLLFMYLPLAGCAAYGLLLIYIVPCLLPVDKKPTVYLIIFIVYCLLSIVY